MVHHRLHVVECGGKKGGGRFPLVEFLPERDALIFLVCWQEAETAFGGLVFPFLFSDISLYVVERHVSRVNFHNIVENEHFHGLNRVYSGIRSVIRKDHCHERDVP